ncbi:MAG: hypothetical protein V3S84_04515 [Dehalococcoidales bacterium]
MKLLSWGVSPGDIAQVKLDTPHKQALYSKQLGNKKLRQRGVEQW